MSRGQCVKQRYTANVQILLHDGLSKTTMLRHARDNVKCKSKAIQLIQEALLSQRDRATRLSVEILQLQNIAIVWNYLCDPTFSRFYTIPKCDRHTHTQIDERTDTRRRHVLRLA